VAFSRGLFLQSSESDADDEKVAAQFGRTDGREQDSDAMSKVRRRGGWSSEAYGCILPNGRMNFVTGPAASLPVQAAVQGSR